MAHTEPGVRPRSLNHRIRAATIGFAVAVAVGCAGTSSGPGTHAEVAPGPEPALAKPPTTKPVVVKDPRYTAAAEYSARHNGHVLLVIRRNQIVYEAGQNGHRAETPHRLFSGTKSFWGALAAAADSDGLLDLDEPVVYTIPEFESESWKKEIRIRHLLRGTSGLETGFVMLRTNRPENWYDTSLQVPTFAKPGEAFRYGPSHLFVFGEVLKRKLAKGGADPLAYLKRRILDPIGVEVADWDRDAAGNPDLPAGATMAAREWGKFGLLLANRGRWDGRPLIAEDALEECFEGDDTAPFYGLGLWLNYQSAGRRYVIRAARQRTFYEGDLTDMLVAAGAGNQRLYVIPSLDLVIVRFGGADRSWSDQDFLDLVVNAARS